MTSVKDFFKTEVENIGKEPDFKFLIEIHGNEISTELKGKQGLSKLGSALVQIMDSEPAIGLAIRAAVQIYEGKELDDLEKLDKEKSVRK